MKKIKVYIAVVSTWNYDAEDYTFSEMRCFATHKEMYEWAEEVKRNQRCLIEGHESEMEIKED